MVGLLSVHLSFHPCIRVTNTMSRLDGGKACEQTTLEGKCAGWHLSLIHLWTPLWLEKPSISSFSLHSPSHHTFRAISAQDKWVKKEAGTASPTMPLFLGRQLGVGALAV